MEPYNQFHARVKQMTALVDKPINHINGQIEVFEDKRIKERQAEIEKIYMEEIGDMGGLSPALPSAGGQVEQCQRLCQVYPKGNIRGHSRRQGRQGGH